MKERKIDIIADNLLEKFSEWSLARDSKQSRWMDYTRIARLIDSASDKSKDTEKSTIKMPTTKSAITMTVDNLYQMLFGSFQFFNVEGRTPDDNPELLKFYLVYLLDKAKFKNNIKKFLYDLCCYGTGICQVDVVTVNEKRLVQKSRDRGGILKRFRNKFIKPINNNKKEKVTVESKQINRPSFEWIDIFNFYIEPQALSIDSATGIIVRKQQKFHVLSQMQEDGVISGVEHIASKFARDTRKLTDGEIQTGGIDADRQERLRQSGLIADLKDGDVSLIEYWGWLDADLLKDAGYDGEIKNGGAEVTALIANGNTVLKLTPNPFLTNERPFYKETFEDLNGEFYGMGICEIANGPQRALDATIRSRIDNKRIAINQVFAIDANRMSDLNTSDIFTGKVYWTEGDPRGIIQQLQIADVTNGSYIEAQEFERAIHEATGISPIVGGQTSAKSQTATEVSILQSQSSIRIRMIALQVEANIIEPVLRKFYQIALQFFNEEEIIKVTNGKAEDINDLKEITVSDIIGDYDFKPLGVLNITAKADFIKIMDFLTRTANQFDVGVTNRPLLLKKAYESLGFNDADEVFSRDMPVGREILQRASGVKGVGSPPSSDGQEASNVGGALV